jgi:four helix bundle protein
MRNHHRLEVFGLADRLALSVYELTRTFPHSERYLLTDQLRRAAVSVASNIVEGSARRTERDYVRFLGIAYGSACELEYQISIARRLGYLMEERGTQVGVLASRTCRALRGLINAYDRSPRT